MAVETGERAQNPGEGEREGRGELRLCFDVCSSEPTLRAGRARCQSQPASRCLAKGTPPLLKWTPSKGRLWLGHRALGNRGRLPRGELHTPTAFFLLWPRIMAAFSNEEEFNDPERFSAQGRRAIASSAKETFHLMRHGGGQGPQDRPPSPPASFQPGLHLKL